MTKMDLKVGHLLFNGLLMQRAPFKEIIADEGVEIGLKVVVSFDHSIIID